VCRRPVVHVRYSNSRGQAHHAASCTLQNTKLLKLAGQFRAFASVRGGQCGETSQSSTRSPCDGGTSHLTTPISNFSKGSGPKAKTGAIDLTFESFLGIGELNVPGPTIAPEVQHWRSVGWTIVWASMRRSQLNKPRLGRVIRSAEGMQCADAISSGVGDERGCRSHGLRIAFL
jgi:hypothetical protein